jgi:hypothetical protein
MKLTNLTYHQQAELAAVAAADPTLGITVYKTTADVPQPLWALERILDAIQLNNQAGLRGPVTALHSVKRKIHAQL